MEGLIDDPVWQAAEADKSEPPYPLGYLDPEIAALDEDLENTTERFFERPPDSSGARTSEELMRDFFRFGGLDPEPGGLHPDSDDERMRNAAFYFYAHASDFRNPAKHAPLHEMAHAQYSLLERQMRLDPGLAHFGRFVDLSKEGSPSGSDATNS